MEDCATLASPAFLNRATEAGRLIAEHDWSATGLGAIAAWPPCLKSTVGLMLHSSLPMALLWGEDGYMIYNDGYATLAGARHPELLGRKVREAWPEVAALNDRAIRAGLKGGTLAYRDQELSLHRGAKREQVWMNLDYSPVPDENGDPCGVMVIVGETTERVLAERRVAEQRDRMRQMFQQAPGFMAMVDGPEHVLVITNAAYMRLIGEDRTVIGCRVVDALPEAAAQGFVRLLDGAFVSGKPFVGEGLKVALPDARGRIEEHYVDFVCQPVRDFAGTVTGIFVAGSDVTERVWPSRRSGTGRSATGGSTTR